MSRLPSIKINKPSGLLYLKDIISVGGNWEYVSGEVDAVSKNSTIVFRNIFNHPLIDGEGVDQDMIFNHIYIYYNKQLNGNLTVEGNLIINGNFNSFSYNLFLKGNIENNGTFNTGDGTVYFDGNSSILGANVITFNNIHILNEANLTAHPTNFKLRGNFNVLGNFYPLNGTVVFEGSNAQFIEKEGSEMTFYNLNINKSAEHITLLGKVEIQNELLFNSGNILTSDSFLLTFLPNSFTTNVNNNSFVSGPVKKIGNTSFAFPVGKSGVYQPITISSPSFISDVFVAEYFDNEQLFGNNLEDNLLSISSCEYWTLNRVHGSSSVNVTLGWNSNSCDIPDDMAKIRVAGWDGVFWQNLGNAETNGDLLNGHIKSLDFPTHFNHYVLGTSNSLIPINEDENVEEGLCGYDPKKELYYNTQEAKDSIMTAVFSHSHLVQVPCGDNFVLTFDDHDSGFDDPILGEKRRDCACEVFKYIESVIDINLNGTDLDDKINFIFYKSDFPASSTVLAYAGAFQNNDFISLNPGIYGGNVHEKITTGNDPDEDFMFDGYIRVNFNYNYQLCNSSNFDCRYDLFSIILHEVGHSLGLISFIGEDVDLKPVNKVGNNRYTIWDSFIHYGEITTGVFEPLIQSSPPQINNNIDFPEVLRSGKLWTKNAGMYNNNQPVYSGNFTGNPFLNSVLLHPGSLVSHLDAMVFSYSFRTNFSPGYPVDFVMNPTFRGGKINRVFSIPELRVFVDLGYSINPMFSDYNTTVLNTPPYTTKTTPSHAYDTYPDMIETPDYTITNDGTPLVIVLNNDNQLVDNEGDVISVEPNTLFNIRGCGDGNNHDRVTISADGTEISYIPRPDFIGRAQFGFYLWDGKERGSFMSYTIDVLKGSSFLNHPNSNTPIGQDELIINGDFEQGTEIKTFNSNLEQLIPYSSLDYGHPNVVGEYFAGVTFSDANPLLYTNHAWTWGYGGVITRKSFKQCNPNDVYVNSFGVIAFNFPNPFNVTHNTPLPHNDQGDRYHYLMNRHNYFTLSEEMIPCENYILTFDVNFRISQHPIGSEYTLKIGFTETADTERLYNYLTEKTIVIEPDWNKISIPLKYCGNNPSFFLNLEGTVGKVLIDNISLVVDPSPPVLTVDLGSDVELCQGESILLNAEIANESCDLIYNWSPAEGLSDTDIKNPTASPLNTTTYTITVTNSLGCEFATDQITIIVNPLPDTEINHVNTLCLFDNPITLTTSGESGGTWSGIGIIDDVFGVFDPTVAGAGAHTVFYEITDVNGCFNSSQLIIDVNEAPTISFTDYTNIVCFGESNGQITIIVTGGTSPYSYQWSNNETTETNSGLTAGVYTVTVTDANNCVLTDNYIIEQSNELVLSTVLTEDILCYGQNTGSISLTVTGGITPYSYQWSNNETTETNSGLTAGVYTVTVTDANNCVLTDNYIIEQSNELVLSTVLTEDILCYGQSTGNISITVEGGVSPYTYQWSNNETTETISGLNSGAYTVTITDDYICSIITSITISEASALSAQVASIKHDCPNTLLGIGNATLEVVGGQEPYQYQWNDVNNQTTATAVMLNEGTYIATITDANNCSTTIPVIITVTPSITNSLEAFAHPSCFGSSDGFIDFNVGGGIPPYTFIWSNGATTEDIDGLSGSPLGTIYALSVIDNNDCQLLTSFPMIEPLPISILVSITDILCSNNTTSIVVDASGGTGAKTFEWSTNTTGNSLVDVGAGIYSVTATDINGCTASESFMITEPDLIVINGVTNANDCFGGISGSIITSVTGGISPYTYLWNNNATDASLSGLSAGIYTVTVIDDNNCTMSHAFVVEQPATLELLLTTSSIDCFGNQNGSIASVSSGGIPPYTFIWSNGATTTFINNLGANIYTLTVTDNNQCIAIASANITEPDLLEMQLVASSENCNTRDGYIEANVSGGVLPYTFLWSNGATTSSVSELSAGAYTLTLSDNNGCLLVQSIDVDAFPVYNTVATQIFGNVTWSSDMYIDQYIYVNFDAVLNINNGAHISFAPFAGIIVRPGGTLNVTNNAVLSGIIPCQKMWQGVTVEGNSLIAHPSYFNISHPDHGLIRVANATIRDARTAIYAGFMRRKSPFLPILSNTFGGIVLASNATFLNNIVAVKIDGELPKANRSSLNRCRFIYDHQAFYDAFALNNGVVFVSFDNSYGVKIAGCYFENEVLSTLIEQQRGYGILSNNAGFTVSRACNILSPIGGEGCVGDKNTFKGLSYGIYASGINSLRKRVEIDQAVFEENFRGIYLRGQQFPVVTRNTFKVGNLSYLPNLPLDMTNPYGLYLDYCDDYTIEENEFYNSAAQGSLYNTYGMVVRNTGAEANEIYRNVFHHSGIGMAAFGEPEHNSNEQLQIKCNDFIENIAISDFISGSTNSKIADPQGFCTPIPTTPAGNTFSYSSAALFWDFYAWDHRTVYKHHDLTLSNTDIFPRQQVITPDECALVRYTPEDACPTRFGGGGGGVIGIKDRIARNGEKLHEAQQLIDGGNTQQLLDLIVTGNAGQVKNTLLQYAPYLSNVVLITYVQSTPPAGNLKEVVLANAPVADAVMETIIQQQLPKGIMNEINAMQTGVSPRKAVDEQISYYGGQWSMAISDLALHYLNDTLQNNLDSVIMVLQMEQGPGVQKQLAAAFTENKQFEEARQTIGNLDNDEFEIFKQVQKLLIDFDEQQIEYTNISISSDTVQSFWIYASDTTRKGYVEARGILQLLVDTVYFPEYFDPLPVFSGLAKMFDTTQPNNKAPKMAQTIVTDTITTYSLTNYPNPFTGGTTIQVESPAKGKIKVFDIMGRELMSIPTTEGIFITEINDHQLQQGTYYYSLIINNAVVLTQKMIKL
jgi:hypothetical protein